ncbi:MAG: hypothetical protein LBN21_00860 [Treponema sp.]|jgi:hypothetical protein|nr:hypothetical protein [Treponema sp.]
MIKDLVDIRDEAVSQIKSAINKKEIHVAESPGQFNEAEIKRLATKTPAIITSLMRYSDEDHTVHFVSWVLYRATSTDRLYDGALKIVSALTPIIRELDAEWSIGGGEDIVAECLYSGTLDQINITLWGVKWDWHITEPIFVEGEGGSLTDADLEYFDGYDATHHVGNSVAEDIVNLEVQNANTD